MKPINEQGLSDNLSESEKFILNQILSKAIEYRVYSVSLYKTYLEKPEYKYRVDFIHASIFKFESEIFDLKSLHQKLLTEKRKVEDL